MGVLLLLSPPSWPQDPQTTGNLPEPREWGFFLCFSPAPITPSHAEADWVPGEAVTPMPATQEVLVISRTNTELKSMYRSQTQPHSVMWILSQKVLDVGIDSCEASCWQGTVIPVHKLLQNQSRYLICLFFLKWAKLHRRIMQATSFALQLRKAEHPQHFLDFSLWKKIKLLQQATSNWREPIVWSWKVDCSSVRGWKALLHGGKKRCMVFLSCSTLF